MKREHCRAPSSILLTVTTFGKTWPPLHCGDDVCCGRVRTSDAGGHLSNKVRHLQQFLPGTLDPVERGDTTPRGCGPDLRSRLRPSRQGDGRGYKHTGFLTKLWRPAWWLKRMMSELCGWTLTVIGMVGGRSKTQFSRATPPPFPRVIWTRRLLP